MSITIRYDDSALRQSLQQLYERMGDLSPAMDSIGFALEQNLRRRFETLRDPNGKTWQGWGPSTAKSYPKTRAKDKKGGGQTKNGPGRGKLLQRYGSMLSGISYSYDKTSVSIGFDQPYAAYHEWGTKHMPRRGLLTANPNTGELGKEDAQTIIDIIGQYLSKP